MPLTAQQCYTGARDLLELLKNEESAAFTTLYKALMLSGRDDFAKILRPALTVCVPVVVDNRTRTACPLETCYSPSSSEGSDDDSLLLWDLLLPSPVPFGVLDLVVKQCENIVPDVKNTASSMRIPTSADTFIAMASSDRYKSFRSPILGSWFIRELCLAIAEHSDKMHIGDITTTVNRLVSEKLTEEGDCQMPQISSTLRKQLFFFLGIQKGEPVWINNLFP